MMETLRAWNHWWIDWWFDRPVLFISCAVLVVALNIWLKWRRK